MKISYHVDQAIKVGSEFRPVLSNDKTLNQDKFTSIFETSIEKPQSGSEKEIPNWVDSDYEYNLESPRKPNMREMIQEISGKSVEELYADPNSKWQDISNLASELLYGVVGDTSDIRNWKDIMSSVNIIEAARHETNKMHKPVIDIASELGTNGKLNKQYAVIKDYSGKTLKSLTGSPESAELTLKNFAINAEAIPSNLDERVSIEYFDKSILSLLKKLPGVANSALHNLDKIYWDEYNKL